MPPPPANNQIVAVRSASFVVSSRPAELHPHVGVALAEFRLEGPGLSSQAAADTPPSWNSGGRSRSSRRSSTRRRTVSLCLVIPVHLRNSRCKVARPRRRRRRGPPGLADREKAPTGFRAGWSRRRRSRDRSGAAAGIGHRSLYKTEVIDRRGPWFSIEGGRPGHPSGGSGRVPYLTVYFCTNGVGTLVPAAARRRP